jgi:RES domain-containing protein
MVRAWHLGQRRHSDPAPTAFDGRGSEINGGRWNPIGILAAYAGSSRSLCALEYLVYLDRALAARLDLVFTEVSFDSSDLEIAAPPAGWQAPGSLTAVSYGQAWLREQRSLVLQVPSVVIREEANYVINPRHPRASALVYSASLEPFAFDDRLFT